MQTAHTLEVGHSGTRRFHVPEGPEEPDVSIPQTLAEAEGDSCSDRQPYHEAFILTKPLRNVAFYIFKNCIFYTVFQGVLKTIEHKIIIHAITCVWGIISFHNNCLCLF